MNFAVGRELKNQDPLAKVYQFCNSHNLICCHVKERGSKQYLEKQFHLPAQRRFCVERCRISKRDCVSSYIAFHSLELKNSAPA